jgi:Ca-activated chloride channel homolog
MKKKFTGFILTLFSFCVANATGVLTRADSTGTYLHLNYDSVSVTITDQIVQVTTRQLFANQLDDSIPVKYCFPLNQGASVIDLRWKYNNIWYDAVFSASPQDTTLGGTGNNDFDFLLSEYLGNNGFYFDFASNLPAGAEVVIELTYVLLMPYELGVSSFVYPSDYSVIQSEAVDFFMNIDLQTQRIIEDMQSLYAGAVFSFSDYSGNLICSQPGAYLSSDLLLEITFNSDDLGMFGYSTFTDTFEEAGCDTLGKGFMGFILEPPVSENVQVMQKIFTMVIDRSGSMSGTKIEQAKQAASYIVEHLNENDLFNIVDFSSEPLTLFNDHVQNTPENVSIALDYISGIVADGGTNISGALITAIEQFSGANQNAAHLIVFMTDGQASDGITDTQQLLAAVQNERVSVDSNCVIFSFGIGSDVNLQLLNLLALQNNGICTNISNDQVYEEISAFYQIIANPVVINPMLSFDPPYVFEVYPNQLQNLYQGQQLRVFGRYIYPDTVTVSLSGQAFGEVVNYDYDIVLTANEIPQYQFLSKMWADQKIKSLQQQYYESFDTTIQQTIEEEITYVSLCYGVISDFTSFSDNSGNGGGSIGIEEQKDKNIEFYNAIYPNPVNNQMFVSLDGFDSGEKIELVIYAVTGQVICSMKIIVNTSGIYRLDESICRLIPDGLFFIKLGSGTNLKSAYGAKISTE